MEMLAAWVPTTPEMEAKLVLGTHIWDIAQHADSFGKRTHELRLPLQHSIAPSADYARFLGDLAATTETSKRIAGFYDCMLPALDRMFREYLTRVDPLLDGPTVRILERVTTDLARMKAEGEALREELPGVRLSDPAWLDSLQHREALLPVVVSSSASVSQAA